MQDFSTQLSGTFTRQSFVIALFLGIYFETVLESPDSLLFNAVPTSAWKQGTGGLLMSEGSGDFSLLFKVLTRVTVAT